MSAELPTVPSYQELLATFAAELHVEPQGDDLFLGATDTDREWGRVFGGLVLGQAALAAGRTAPDPTLHSLHAYFLRGGEPGTPIEYMVERVRDGRSFTSRRVLARQGGKPICDVTVSFVHPEDGISHNDPMPDVPDPETLQDAREQYPLQDGTLWPLGPVEWRVLQPFDEIAKPGERTEVREWFRFRAPLPDDPQLHAAALAWCSDTGSFSGIERRYGWEGVSHKASASLDHAFWLHRPVRLDGWFLMVTDTPVAHASRALTMRRFYARDGAQIATMAQEAVFRKERPA